VRLDALNKIKSAFQNRYPLEKVAYQLGFDTHEDASVFLLAHGAEVPDGDDVMLGRLERPGPLAMPRLRARWIDGLRHGRTVAHLISGAAAPPTKPAHRVQDSFNGEFTASFELEEESSAAGVLRAPHSAAAGLPAVATPGGLVAATTPPFAPSPSQRQVAASAPPQPAKVANSRVQPPEAHEPAARSTTVPLAHGSTALAALLPAASASAGRVDSAAVQVRLCCPVVFSPLFFPPLGLPSLLEVESRA
jgi:hypothetical protein